MKAYGLPPAGYFRFAKRPIDVRYRAGIIPGYGDGRTVNAQVRWTVRPNPEVPTIPTGEIEIRFALGDLESAVGRLPANLPSAVERSPLGLASDPRWCWHEYCHVLLAAAVGDLEFRFAHSAGDAIAAIVSDPDSELAYDRSGALSNDGPWRGVTFPWVFIPRRHDRRVQDGWGWTGPMNRPEVYFVVPGLSDKRGYWTEQILSSALFRLYRAIGGDSEILGGGGLRKAAKTERGRAADYVVYLIMRAIESLGAASVTPSTTAGRFRGYHEEGGHGDRDHAGAGRLCRRYSPQGGPVGLRSAGTARDADPGVRSHRPGRYRDRRSAHRRPASEAGRTVLAGRPARAGLARASRLLVGDQWPCPSGNTHKSM